MTEVRKLEIVAKSTLNENKSLTMGEVVLDCPYEQMQNLQVLGERKRRRGDHQGNLRRDSVQPRMDGAALQGSQVCNEY